MNQVVMIFGKLLEVFYSCTGDYGAAIVCLTVFVKLCLLPLYARQRKRVEAQQAGGVGSCLVLFLTLPVLTGLYRTVLTGAPVGSRLCPWVVSLLARDPYGILPALSAAMQLLPQLYPYLRFFRELNIPKAPKGMVLSSVVMIFLICLPLPAAVGLYYVTAGIFSAIEQAVRNGARVYRLRAG